MPYCTLSDLTAAIPEDRVIQLTDDTGDGIVDETKVGEAIDYADTLIDGHLRGRYTLPLSPVPKLVNKLSVDLAIWHLYARRPEIDVPDSIMERYRNALKLLRQVQNGEIKLGIETPAAGPGAGEYKTNKTASDKMFGKTVLDTF